ARGLDQQAEVSRRVPGAAWPAAAPGGSVLLHGYELSDQAVGLLVRSGAEPHRVGTAGRCRTGQKPPQPVNLDHTVPVAQQAEELPVAVRADPAVAEVADEQRAGQLAPRRRGDREAPRRVERA